MLDAPWKCAEFHDLFAATAAMAKSHEITFENRLEVFYSLLTDLLELPLLPKSGALRNPDMREELERLGRMLDVGLGFAGNREPGSFGKPAAAQHWNQSTGVGCVGPRSGARGR